MDLTEDGRRLKMMPVVDEYTRECLRIDQDAEFLRSLLRLCRTTD
jgi:hypothetical protein